MTLLLPQNHRLSNTLNKVFEYIKHMCGIIGCLGGSAAVKDTLDGLKSLEYRGYDSAGIAYLDNNKIKVIKSTGSVDKLIEKVKNTKTADNFRVSIGHTRWATHGAVTETNAHPHISLDGNFAVVHNGTIDNYKDFGFKFKSETDTEVIPNLIQKYFTGSLLDAVKKTTELLKGSYAFAVISPYAPDTVVAAKHGTPPLVIGKGIDTHFITSDIPTAQKQTNHFYIMDSDEIAVVTNESASFYKNGCNIEKPLLTYTAKDRGTSLGGFDTWMEKEIHDIPEVLKRIVSHYSKNKTEIKAAAELLKNASCIHITACGTSYHAGLILGHLLEKHCEIRTKVYIASEFISQARFNKNDIGIVLTQSGETADTINALNHLRANNIPIIAICNVVLSSIARGCNVVLPILAGSEFAVASTKAYCAQVLVGAILAHTIRPLCRINEFKKLPQHAKNILTANGTNFAAPCVSASKIFFLGKGLDYCTALEAALKVKEITYMHCEGYAAGELKHGTLSLVDSNTHCFFFDGTLVNTAAEVSARGSRVHIFDIPQSPLNFIYKVIPAQILALKISLARGLDPDKPRNLAKSVTVE